MHLYPLLQKAYEHVATLRITTKKQPLTPSLVGSFRQELADKPFLHDKLESLLQQPEYVTLSCASIHIHYIPVRELTQKRMKQVLRRLVSMTQVMHLEKTFHIWFLPCKVPRRFPKGEPVSTEHINGGYTYTFRDIIYVYRYDEFPKVFLHEVLHHSVVHLDTWSKENLLRLYKAFEIDTTHCDSSCQTKLVPNEAIVEAWATMFHIACLSIEKKLPLQILYTMEMTHSLSMTHRLWNYQKDVYPMWKEETHSYSYIRLKTCILYFWKKFEEISYPYQDQELTDFLLTHNKKRSFLQQIQAAPLPQTDTFQMTCTGNQ